MITITEPRFKNLSPFPRKIWLSSPTMHGEEQKYADEAIRTNWVSTVGENIDEIERQVAEYIGVKYAVALSSGTAALHLAIRLAAERLYGTASVGHGSLEGRKVFVSDMTFDATVNPVAYEGGEIIPIDTEYDSWNMSPRALARAFEIYPDVKMVVLAHLYGTPAKMDEILSIAHAHHALVVEDAAESFGALYGFPVKEDKENGEEKGKVYIWKQTGALGDIGIISFNGNKIVTGSSGGMLLTDSQEEARRIRKWSTQSREEAPWYQHEELGYNYRMSNVVAGIVRGQLPYLSSHIDAKMEIYERYKNGLADLPVRMNPIPENCQPNYWLSCLVIDKGAMCETLRSEKEALYISVPGKSCPTEILEALSAFNAEGRPIWKPMHMQPIYRGNSFVGIDGMDTGADVFRRGVCLPSDNKMTEDEQEVVIDIIHRCFW